MSQLLPLTLRGSLFAFVSLCLLSVLAALSVFIYLKAERLMDEVLDYTTRFRTTAAVEELAHSLEQE
ncbi:MAG: hypothetical protein FJX25_19290 [Alphaproteobacteria bacterium]|nr:hypothetical protein [Alphaproteobacteria bacterium]